MKIGIIVDSSAGITKAEAEKRGWGFLPLYLTINGKDFADGIDLDSKKYFSTIKVSDDVRTSATPPGLVNEVLEKATKKFDHVIIYGLSKELSSQTNNITMIADDFKNVTVIPSCGVGYAIVRDIENAKDLIEKGNVKKVVEFLTKQTNGQVALVIPQIMDWLVKGGRVSSSAASMANLLKIVPIIIMKKGKLDKYGKGRVFKKAILKAAEQLKSELKEDREWMIYDAHNSDVKDIKEMLEKELKIKLTVHEFPPVIGNHTGPGAIGIYTVLKK